MTSDEPESFFPELDGEEQCQVDEWLHDYLRLVLQIRREYLEEHADDYPQQPD